MVPAWSTATPSGEIRPLVILMRGLVAPLMYSLTFGTFAMFVTQRFPRPSIAQNAGFLIPFVIFLNGFVVPRAYSEIPSNSLATYRVPSRSTQSPAGVLTPFVMTAIGLRLLDRAS